MDEKKVDLRALKAPGAGKATLNDGSEHVVLQTPGRVSQAHKPAPAGERADRAYAAAKELVPTATSEQIDDLSLTQVDALLTLAGAGIQAVEDRYPNAVSPAASTS